MGCSHDYAWCWADPHQQYWLSLKKIYIQVDGKACLFEIIIGYYFHIMLLEAIVGEKRALKTLKNANKMATSTLGIGLKSLEYEISEKD